jgi:hypothetical protein
VVGVQSAPPGFLRLAGHPLRWRLLTELARSDQQVRELTGGSVQAGWSLLGPSWTWARTAGRARQVRWAVYLLVGGAAAATIGPWLALVLLGCGVA